MAKISSRKRRPESTKARRRAAKRAPKARIEAGKKAGANRPDPAGAEPGAKAPRKGQWVYALRRRQGRRPRRHENLLGGKGANLAEMANLGLPVPPGFTITTEVCTYYYANGRPIRRTSKAAGRGGARPGRPHHRQDVRRRDQSAARLGALRRPRLDAGHDGHGAQSRPQRRDGGGAGEEVRRPALRLRQLSPLHHDVLRRRARPRSSPCSRRSSTSTRTRTATRLDTDLTADDWAALVERYKARVEEEQRQAVPAGPARAALGRHRRRVRLVDEPARHHLSPPARHPGELGHGGQRAGDGVRQHGRHLGDRRRLHAQSVDRREAALRRVPDQRPGRGRRRRHPHAAGAHRGRARGSRLRQAVDGKRDAGGVQGARPHLRHAREALPRHAGPRVHGRAGQAVDAADPLGQAHRQGGAEDRGRPGATRS